jgi:hypothetical protein
MKKILLLLPIFIIIAVFAGKAYGIASGKSGVFKKFVPTVAVKTLKSGQYTVFRGATKNGDYISMLVGKTGVIVFSLQKLKSQVKTKEGKYINHYNPLPIYEISFYFNAKTNVFGVRVSKNHN